MTAVAAGDRLVRIEDAIRARRAGEALQMIRLLPAELRNRFDVMAREADLLGKLGKHDQEIALYDRLLAMQPDSASLRLGLAHTLKTIGRTTESVVAARGAIALRPTYGKAWWLLSDLKSFRFDEADVAAMEAALAGELEPADRFHFHFALGRAFEQAALPDQAFDHYAKANALRREAVPPQKMSVTRRVERMIAMFTPSFFAERSGQGSDSDAPIFIVGLHRSGSTLIEQILGSHSLIEATSELPLMPQLFREIAQDASLDGGSPVEKVAALDAKRLRALGETYLERAKAYRRTGKPHFTDKLPANWLHIGLIRLILPKARIVDARRHPMAAGFSNFRQNYGSGVEWSYDQAAIGRYYRDYVRLLEHFDQVEPGAVHRAVNERLIDDFEPEVRRLLDYAGVPFEPACLDFHRGGRAVRSASAEQVRRPVNRDGVDQWRAFEPWLGELKEALGPALEDWDKP